MRKTSLIVFQKPILYEQTVQQIPISIISLKKYYEMFLHIQKNKLKRMSNLKKKKHKLVPMFTYLSGFEGPEAGGPPSLVSVLHELLYNMGGGGAIH